MPSSIPPKNSAGKGLRILKKAGTVLGSLLGFIFAIWAFGFITYCCPLPAVGNFILAILWAAAGFTVRYIRKEKWQQAAGLGLAIVFLILFFSIRPSHDRDWVDSQEITSSATVIGDKLHIQGFRTFDYGLDELEIGKWEARSYDLNKIKGMDFFMTHWTSDLAGHPIFSFDFGDQGHLAFTIEARLEKGEEYSLLAGLYPRFELSYIPCEESDAVRVRTNFRKNEDVYLYKTIATPEQARARLLEFIDTMNDIERKPRFYNVISSNCTTAVRSQMTGGFPFDWRIIINGKLDEMLYERGLLETDGLSFAELKGLGYLNPKLRNHPQKEGFSERIRKGISTFD